MKALISAISLAVLLVGAATAQAVSGNYHGNNADGGLVVFGTQLRHGHNHTVHPFLTGNVVLHCPSGGELGRSYNTNQTMRVSKKERFSGLLSPVTDPDQEVDPTIVTTIQVTGVFTHRERKAVGTLRVHQVGSLRGDCDSGIVSWAAKSGSAGGSPRGALP